jgi:hypothetical protein
MNRSVDFLSTVDSISGNTLGAIRTFSNRKLPYLNAD